MYRILILDDEIPSARMIERLLNKNFPFLEVITNIQTVKEAAEYLGSNHVDIVFLDLQLNGESGFDLLDKMNPRTFDFICLSATSEYAYKAFEYNSSGYLLKPVSSNELINAVSAWFRMRHIIFGNKQSW